MTTEQKDFVPQYSHSADGRTVIMTNFDEMPLPLSKDPAPSEVPDGEPEPCGNARPCPRHEPPPAAEWESPEDMGRSVSSVRLPPVKGYFPEPPPTSPPASDAGGEPKFKPRCMVLVRGKHRCIKDDGHGPDNDLGDVVHQDERGELFCEQGKLASPPSGQGPTEALRTIKQNPTIAELLDDAYDDMRDDRIRVSIEGVIRAVRKLANELEKSK